MTSDTIKISASAGGRPGRHIVTAAKAGVELHRHTFDLNNANARKQFVTATLLAAYPDKKPGDYPKAERADLEQQLLALAAVPPGPPEPPVRAVGQAPKDPRIAQLQTMPEDVRAEAEALLSDKRLAERITSDIAAVGVVGEQKLALLIYLIGVSAQLEKPLAAISRGASSSGKSYTIARVAELFPPEVVLHATSLTTNALYYFPTGMLRHRWVVAGERSRMESDEHAEATRAVREMIEAGRLSKALPVKEGDQLVTRVIEQDGPIAYIESTTAAHIDEEDANRCLLLATDESQNQTGRILTATAKAAAGYASTDNERRKVVHHAVQRMIPRCAVIIPFAEAIAAKFPTARLEARRDFRHFLQLIKASTLLHFKQRERDSNGAIVATLADYALAEKLARGPLGVAATGVTAEARKYLEALHERFADREFSTVEAKAAGRGSGRAKFNRLCELNNSGSVEQTQPGKGRVPAKWRLTGTEPDAGLSVLPTVAEVQAELERCKLARET